MDPKLLSVLYLSVSIPITPDSKAICVAIVQTSKWVSQWCHQWNLWCVHSSDNVVPRIFFWNMRPCQCSWTSSMSDHQTTCFACQQTQNCQREPGRESCATQERHSDSCWTGCTRTPSLTKTAFFKAWACLTPVPAAESEYLLGLIQMDYHLSKCVLHWSTLWVSN